jgi:hypothetical protein
MFDFDVFDYVQAESREAAQPSGRAQHPHFPHAKVGDELRADAIGTQFTR